MLHFWVPFHLMMSWLDCQSSINMMLCTWLVMCRVTDVAVEAIVRSCKNLTNLNISGCKVCLICHSFYPFPWNFVRPFAPVEHFECDEWSSFFGSCLLILGCASIRIRSVSLLWYAVQLLKNNLCVKQNITDKSLYNVAKYVPHLQSLNLTRCGLERNSHAHLFIVVVNLLW